MIVTSINRLDDFGRRHVDALAAWLSVVTASNWKNPADAKRTYGSLDPAVPVKSGRKVAVFNIKGNRYRLITRIDYQLEIVNVIRVMTHAEYSAEMERVFMSATRVIRTARSAVPAAEDDYLELVREFPLRPIRSKVELNLASTILDRLVGRDDLTVGQRDYVLALAHFVRLFEDQIARTMFARLKPVEVLRHLMRENNMNTSDLGAILGSRGLASEVLNGKRGLSKTLILKLQRRFQLDPAVFLDAELEAHAKSTTPK